MKETYEFLKDAGIFYLATVDEEGNPRVRPFGALAYVNDTIFLLLQRKRKYIIR